MLVEVRCLGWGREGCALEADWEECMQSLFEHQRVRGSRRSARGRRAGCSSVCALIVVERLRYVSM